MDVESDEYMPTRRSLLSRLKNWRDDESWREFFNTYWKLIYNAALKGGLRHDEAENVVQETMQTVAKAMPGFRYDPAVGSFKGFLLQTTRWKIADYLKRVRKKDVASAYPRAVDREDGTATIERIPDEASLKLNDFWEKEWQKNLEGAALERVKKRVSPKTYQLFELRVLKEWPVAKIVNTLGVKPEQVHLAKCRVSDMIEVEIRKLEAKGF